MTTAEIAQERCVSIESISRCRIVELSFVEIQTVVIATDTAESRRCRLRARDAANISGRRHIGDPVGSKLFVQEVMSTAESENKTVFRCPDGLTRDAL